MMKNIPALMHMTATRPLLFLTCALAMSGCGGGGGATPPAAPASTTQTCGFDLIYADGATSGYVVASTVTSVPKSILPCGITQVQSVTLGICLKPAQTNELKVQLLNAANTAITLDLATATVTSSSKCQLDQGTMYNVSLPSNALSSDLNGNWLLSVQDTVPGFTSSTFVGWSLEVKGLK